MLLSKAQCTIVYQCVPKVATCLGLQNLIQIRQTWWLGVLHHDILNISSNGFALGEVELFPGKTGEDWTGLNLAVHVVSSVSQPPQAELYKLVASDLQSLARNRAGLKMFEAGFTSSFPTQS